MSYMLNLILDMEATVIYRSKSEAQLACNRANHEGGGLTIFAVRKVRGGGWCVEVAKFNADEPAAR